MTTNSPARLPEIKNSMLDTLIIIILILGIPNMAIVIFNTHLEGHFPYLSVAGLCTMLFSAIFRNRIHFLVKAWMLISFGYFIGTSGLINEGLLSDGVLYYMIIVILSSMLINIRTGIIIMIITIVTSGIIALLISKDLLKAQEQFRRSCSLF